MVHVEAAPDAAAKSTALETPPTSLESASFDWDNDSVPPVRQSRSQSLTDARHGPSRSPSLASSVDGDASRSVAFLVVDPVNNATHEELVKQRQMRRTKSAEHCSLLTLSLLQQELGYPKATPSRERRASRRSRHSASGDVTKDETLGRPAATSDAPTVGTLDDNEAHEEEENFLDHRLASVTGYARDTDGIVYYEIVVESTAHGPLSAYKVRRRYSEFRELHRTLAKLMPTRRQPHRHESRASVGGLSLLSASGYCLDEAEGDSYSTRGLSRSFHDGGLSSSCWLPPLPDNGGVWSYFQSDSPRFLENRARAFHAIITAAQHNNEARASRLLNKFLGPPPDSFANTNYVSLNRFAAPTLRFAIEHQERREKAKTISLKRRQLDPHTVTASPPRVMVTIPPSIAE